MKSIGQKIKQCEGLIGTAAISGWEDEFLKSVVERTAHGANTTSLTDKQVTVVERIYQKHYA